jgi:gamma-glutamyltranspeptidase
VSKNNILYLGRADFLSSVASEDPSVTQSSSWTPRSLQSGTPSSGPVAFSILKIIEGYNMSDSTLLDLNTHRLHEAMRFSYGEHAELGDPDFRSLSSRQ